MLFTLLKSTVLFSLLPPVPVPLMSPLFPVSKFPGADCGDANSPKLKQRRQVQNGVWSEMSMRHDQNSVWQLAWSKCASYSVRAPYISIINATLTSHCAVKTMT